MLSVLEEDIVKQHSKQCKRAASAFSVVLLLATACGPMEGPRPPVGSFVESERKLYSQNDEELLIRHYFADRRGGFFLDVGAYHWKEASTTLYLEKHLGWTGIAIDANKEFAEGYAQNRPATKFLSYFVTDHSGGMEKLFLAGPLSSNVEAHIRSFPGLKDFRPPEVEVPAITLDDLLDQSGVEKIDFLSMDIELGEPAALAGFDIERFRPDLVCIEASLSVRDRISQYFGDHSYERIEEYLAYDYVNWYFRPSKR